MKKKIAEILSLLLFISGCTAITVPDSFSYKEMPGSKFTVASWQKVQNPQAVYKIYIEGDGHAFNAHGMPTDDPTPKGTLIREIAFGDMNENVVYLARPCQYVKTSACEERYWTTARFSAEVIDAEYEAIKKIAGKNPVILVGFSGGAQVAGLLAVTKPDLNIKKVITIAGNLDHKNWTAYHHLPPLKDSLDLNDYQKNFKKINQINYIGEKDKVIPSEISKKFLQGKNLCVVKNASHGEGWEGAYEKIRKER